MDVRVYGAIFVVVLWGLPKGLAKMETDQEKKSWWDVIGMEMHCQKHERVDQMFQPLLVDNKLSVSIVDGVQ